uniref:Uncharacterized protein n=1 Tax=Panagrolaimus davidi TaxID=227884 RepID=A0A914QN79_9BILA
MNKKLTTYESPIHQQNAQCRTVFFEDPPFNTAATITDEEKDENKNTPSSTTTETNGLFRRIGNGIHNPIEHQPSLLNGCEEWKRGLRLSRTKKKAEER